MPRMIKKIVATKPAPIEDEDELEAPVKRGSPAKVKAAAPPAKVKAAAAPPSTETWMGVEVAPEDHIALGDKPPRGKNQITLVEFLTTRGRKKATTFKMVMDNLIENGVSNHAADYCAKTCVLRGVIEIAG